MNEVLTLLSTVPAAVWSGLVAAVAALAGVLIANRSNTTRQRIQLDHDASEKARERTSAVRRDVYLKAVEELAKVGGFLGSLPQQDPTKANLADGMQGLFAAAAKVQLVAEPKTAQLVTQLVGQYGELLLRLLRAVRPMHDAKFEISLNSDHYEKAQKEIERVIADMRRHYESAKPEVGVLAALNESFEFQRAQAAMHAERRVAAWKAFNSGHRDYVRSLLTELQPIAAQQVKVQVAIRHDLGLDGDLSALEAEMECQRMKLSEQVRKYLDELGDA